MALYKTHSITLDTKRTPKIALQNIVVGETGNKLTVTLKNDGSTVSLNGNEYRVCLRVDSAKGVVRQDSSLPNSGITFSSGKAIIMLSRDSFAASLNRCRLEIFSTETDTDDILICSSEFQFTAAINGTGENAGEVYPSLIIAEQEARQATEDANNAASAASAASTSANSAANAASAATEAINELIDNIDNTPTESSENLVTSGGVYSALAGKQDALTFDDTPTLNSANPVKSGGVFSALSEKPVFLGRISSIGNVPPSSSYRIGDYFLYDGGDSSVPIFGLTGVPIKQFDVLVCRSVDGYGNNHTPVMNPAWTDFTVLTGFNHDLTPSDGYPRMDSVRSEAGTSKKYSRADHVHPSDTSKLNVLSAPLIFRLEPHWTGRSADETDIIGATINDIVDAHTSSVQRPIMACVVDPYGAYAWVVESGFWIEPTLNILGITLNGVSKDVSYVGADLQINLTTKEFTHTSFYFTEV